MPSQINIKYSAKLKYEGDEDLTVNLL